jgi:hypothetical protein
LSKAGAAATAGAGGRLSTPASTGSGAFAGAKAELTGIERSGAAGGEAAGATDDAAG